MDKGSLIIIILTCLLAISEALGNIESIKSNSIYQLITGALKALLGKNTDPK